jgi:hypothetical protein
MRYPRLAASLVSRRTRRLNWALTQRRRVALVHDRLGTAREDSVCVTAMPQMLRATNRRSSLSLLSPFFLRLEPLGEMHV